jgi:hypothetical protein
VAEGLAALAARMEPGEAAEAAAGLTQAMGRTADPRELDRLSKGLPLLAARLEPKAAAQVHGRAAAALIQAMSGTTEQYSLRFLSDRLLEMAPHLNPNDASRIAAALTPLLRRATASVLTNLAQIMAALATRMEASDAAGAARILLQQMSRTSDASLENFSSALSRETPAASRRRFLCVTATVAGLTGPGLSPVPFAIIQPALEPVPPPLSPQMLVDLLKHPLCVGEPRRLVLDQLARHYNRPFADPWEFVEYVHQHKLDLDLTTPPQRTDAAPSLAKP